MLKYNTTCSSGRMGTFAWSWEQKIKRKETTWVRSSLWGLQRELQKKKTKKKPHHHHKTTNRLEEGVSACFGGYFHKREKEREGAKVNEWGSETERVEVKKKKKTEKKEKVIAHARHNLQLSRASACLCSHLRHYITLWHCPGTFADQNHIRSSLRFCFRHRAQKQPPPALSLASSSIVFGIKYHIIKHS